MFKSDDIPKCAEPRTPWRRWRGSKQSRLWGRRDNNPDNKHSARRQQFDRDLHAIGQRTSALRAALDRDGVPRTTSRRYGRLLFELDDFIKTLGGQLPLAREIIEDKDDDRA